MKINIQNCLIVLKSQIKVVILESLQIDHWLLNEIYG